MIVLKPKIILTMDKQDRIIKDGYIGIENGKISYIGDKKPQDADELIYLDNYLAIPGLINSHTHVAMTILRGLKDDVDLTTWLTKYIFPAESKLDPDDVYYGSLLGMMELISSGVTTLNDMYYFEERIADATLKIGMRSMLSRGILDLVSEDRSPETELKNSNDFLNYLKKLWNTKPDAKEYVFFAYGPHAPYTCSKELLQLIREEATKNGFRIHIHLSETKWELEEIKRRTGMTPIEYLDSIGFLKDDVMAIHVVWPTEGDINILARRNVKVVHNPISNMKLASGFSPVPKMLEKGITVGLGTDGPASNNRLDMFREMHTAAIIHKGYHLDPKIMSAKTVLKMATIWGAEVLGLSDRIGSLEVGKFADIVFIDLKNTLQAHPYHDIYSMIVYALDSSAIKHVMIGGKWVYKDGEFSHISKDEILEKVESIRHSIINE